MAKRRLCAEDYTVGWITALPIELAAAAEMLDEEHQDLPQDPDDANLYTLGRIGEHNIVIACLPAGQPGTNSAAGVAMRMKSKFKSILFGLMVGIGGGVPSVEADIRLGDVVVSQPHMEQGGVVQYDTGKSTLSGFVRTGSLNTPPALLLNALAKIRAIHLRRKSSLLSYLSALSHLSEFACDNAGPDFLFESTYGHIGGPACEMCSRDRLVERTSRERQQIVIHYGTIASGNQVIRDGVTRDRLSSELGGVLCFEMEAAGLMNSFPCLVIRGICDYADSHKNKRWQPYAAATASAFAKEILSVVPATEVATTRTVRSATETVGGGTQNNITSHGNVANQACQQTVHGGIHINQNEPDLLKLLPIASEAAFNSKGKTHDDACLDGTRADVLNAISAWADGDCQRCIFWLNGMAGTGKSTIARTVAHKYSKIKRLGASFFFSRGSGDVSHANKFFTTIARQLASTFPTLHHHICQAITEHKDIATQTLRDQWDKLILRSLAKLNATSVQSSLIIIIDALDECEGDNDIRLLLQLLAGAKSLQTIRLRVFLTSRPETPIRLGFRVMDGILHRDLVLHNVPRAIVDQDMWVFFRVRFTEIREDSEYLPADWPGDQTIDLLIQKAGGLFIYAATVCRFIKTNDKWSPQHLLEVFLSEDSSHSYNRKRKIPSASPTAELDAIYTQILKHSIKGVGEDKDKEEVAEDFKQVIGSIVILFEPLTAIALGELLDLDQEKIHLRLRHLRSVLNILDESSLIRLLHPSFREFLLDKERCGDPLFWVDEKIAHTALTDACIRLMSDKLRRDICGLLLPGALVEEAEGVRMGQCLPRELQYACRYWVRHLQGSQILLLDDGPVHAFLREHLLNWLEAVSLIRKTSESVAAIISLESMVIAEKAPILYAFIHDAKRFALYNRSIIEEAPLQIYCSALIFAPEESIVREQFKDQMPNWIYRLPRVQRNWSSSLQTLEGHSKSVNPVVFSPDGKLLASASGDETIRLWDPATGAPLQTLEGHSNWVNAVTFSPDGKMLASVSHDKTVRIWDPATGAPLQTLEGHRDWVTAVVFSPDGELLASASVDKTVRLWDPATGAPLQTLEGHSNWVNAVVFSPDGKLLVSASRDDTVRLWDPATGAPLQTLEGLSDWVNGVAFSLDGKLLAFAHGHTVRLWDPATGAPLQTLEGHSNWVNAMVFSPDGKLLASASGDETVRLWDRATGAPLHTLKGHSDSVKAVVFSPDGKLLVSASRDMTIRLWGPATGAPLQTLEGHSNWVNAVVFSPDGKLLASASDDKTVRLWDPATGAPLQPLKGHLNRVTAVVFSPDGKMLVSASRDDTVRIWDPVTGALLQMLEGHLDWVTAVVFSPDGKLLASVSHDKTVRIWDPATGAPLQTLLGHSNWVTAVVFSPDGKLLASPSYDDTIRLWDPATGAPLQTLAGHSNSVNAMTFSPDGKMLASVSHDKTVRIWDPATGAPLHTLKGHSYWVNAVVFSPDGKLLASASRDKTVRLWDRATGAPLHTLKGHSDSVKAVAFSPDGKLLASASGDDTVRVWDLVTGAPLQALKTNVRVRKLSFSSEGQYLDTDRGQLTIGPLGLSAISPRLKGRGTERRIFVNRTWVVQGIKPLLWLPSEYRATCAAVWNDILVLGHTSGRVSILQFSAAEP